MSLVKGSDLTSKEKTLLFWASFLALTAAGFGFSFRVAKGGEYGAEFGLTNLEVGNVFGATLWPIALTMIGFSLIVDRTGYKLPMFGAFALQALAGVGTYFSETYEALYIFALCAGLGHGIVEAVINPICAAVYPKNKTVWLTILHAAWPAGLVFGTLIIVLTGGMDLNWRVHALWILIPAIPYAIMYLPCKFPVDERVQAGVPFKDMLKQVGFLTASLALFLIIYELGRQGESLKYWPLDADWIYYSMGAGIVLGLIFGVIVGGIGKLLFFFLCLLMIPVATAELGTDAWIKNLMEPVLANPSWAIILSASVMLVLRVFAGGIMKHFTPPSLLALSGLLSAVGLIWLSTADGWVVFVAFVIYAIGQTYYWPCILGFTSERYPEGGALTLNTVSAMGLLSVGIIGTPILGRAFDESVHSQVKASVPALAATVEQEKDFLGMKHMAIIPEEIEKLEDAEKKAVQAAVDEAGSKAGRDALRFAAWFPATLVVAFGLIFLYFRARGGYKPVELVDHSDGDG